MDLNLDINQNYIDYNTIVSTIENNINIEILNKKTNCKYDLTITQDSDYWKKYKQFFNNFSNLFELLENVFNKQNWSIINESSEEIYINIDVETIFNFVLIIPKEKDENAYLYRYIKILEEKLYNIEERVKDLENI